MLNNAVRLCRNTFIIILSAFLSTNTTASQPESVIENQATWQFRQVTDVRGRTSIITDIKVKETIFGIFYDAQHLKLMVPKYNGRWVEHLGEITIDGEMLSAYKTCYQDIKFDCKTDSYNFELYLDTPSIQQLKKGKALRTTVKFNDGKLVTFNVPLAGITKAINQLQASWKTAGTTDLMFALLHRDSSQVESLITSESNINTYDQAGRSPLSIVLPFKYYDDEITEQDKELIRLLVKNGANINQLRDNNNLIAHIDGNASADFISFLLDLGANPNHKNSRGELPITQVYRHKNFNEIYQLLVANGADKFATDKSGRTLLHQMSTRTGFSQRQEDISKNIKFLLNEGFDANAKDNEGMTPLIYAAIVNNRETAKWLVQSGAKTNPTLNKNIKAQDELRRLIAKKDIAANKRKTFQNALSLLETINSVDIYFKNKTHAMVQVAIRYRNEQDKWITEAWYNIEPGKDGFVASTENLIFYYLATTKDGRWGGSSKYYYVQGFDEKQGFKKKTMATKHRGDKFTVTFVD